LLQVRRDEAEQRWSQEDAGDHLAHYLRLAEPARHQADQAADPKDDKHL
jgi:hypothetical protein